MAAGIQTKNDAYALDYQKQRDAQTQSNFDASQRGNYDLESARQQRANIVRSMLGLPTVPMPPYVSTSGASTASSNGNSGATLPTINSSGDLATQISSYFRSRGVSDQETPYWVQKWPELVARGQELNDPQYPLKRLAQADVFGGQPSSSTPNSFGSMLAPQTGTATTSPFMSAKANDLPYLQPNSFGAYMGSR
jgi:hypothetical protein